MAFDPTPITDTLARVVGDRLDLSWTSTAPAGSTYQVYQDRRLLWSGQATFCRLPIPPSRSWFNVGVVASSDLVTDFSASLPAAPGVRATLTWQGGYYLDPGLQSFAVYASAAPGGPVNYAAPLAMLPVYDAGIPTDGYGVGGYGSGGYGSVASTYSWTSEPLASGVWQFAVQSITASGVTSTVQAGSVTITGPPKAPASNPLGQRLTYSYDQPSGKATLSWLASPA